MNDASIPVIDISRISGEEELAKKTSKNVSFSAKNESIDGDTDEKPAISENWNNLLQSTPDADQLKQNLHNFYEEEEEAQEN